MSTFTSKAIPLHELAKAIHGEVKGSSDTTVTGVARLEEAGPQDLAYIAHDRMLESAKQSSAGALVVTHYVPSLPHPQLVTPHPHYAFTCLIQKFFMKPQQRTGITQNPVQGDQVYIGPDASIGPFVTIGNRTTIGARVTIHPFVALGNDVTIGDDCILYPHVTILDDCLIGSQVIIHSGTIIGSDGFGYIQHEGRHHKIPQLGHVVIEDDVELGANVTIDRATFGATLIKRGTKIDNLVHIAHNVTIGEDCILTAQVGIAGSTTVGQHVMIAGQAGVTDHVTIGERVAITARAVVTKSVKPDRIVSGHPAMEHNQWRKTQVLLRRLPELYQHVLELENRIKQLEKPGKDT
ncbi:MAG: UDP-3-O-(3-hydroxymyristoyl)glucosamine N-acyltransferase [Nitrospirales bacterium]|nr:UDP-3-O-(3-hydroxymyristoyl)glucosamine N-acyltransferase [Nitrospirales bacterium]